MAETGVTLSGVAKTSLIPLYVRAIESLRPDALLNDPMAVALVEHSRADFAFIDALELDDGDRAALVLRNREFDRHARRFMEQHQRAKVVHIGCGLDARFERVDDGQVQWYDLDLPEVIVQRKEFVDAETSRHQMLPCSVFDKGWLDKVSVGEPLPVMFMAEGVLMYFEEAQVKSLVQTLLNYFPGSELVFDAFSPFLVRMNNLRIRRTGIGASCHWGLKRAKDIETWGAGILLLDEWFPFNQPEPRLANYRWMRFLPLLARVMGIFHYRLGEAITYPGHGGQSPNPYKADGSRLHFGSTATRIV